MDKKQKMRALLEDLQKDITHKNIYSKRKGTLTNVSLVNHFALHNFIPNTWFDWERRVDAPVMIIGQDWGPYVALKKYVDEYEVAKKEKLFDCDAFLIKQFSSRTEKFIMNTIRETYEENHGQFTPNIYNQFFFTMAVLFTRQGKKFRGNELFDEKKSAEISYPFVARQIETVQPKVILTLRNLGFSVVNRYYNLGYTDIKLSSILKDIETQSGIMKKANRVIIPNYHPAAHVNPGISKEIWRKTWENVTF